MKREFGLIRQILVYIESRPPADITTVVEVDCDSPAQVGEHVQLLLDADLIEGEVYDPSEPAFIIQRLTWQGHDFLEAIKNDTVWARVLSKAKELGGSLTMDLIKGLAAKYLAEMAGL